MAAVAALAPVIVPVLFGDKWHASIVLLQILAVVGITRGLTSPVGDLVLAKNRPDLNFRVNAVLLVIMAGAIFAAVHVSLNAVAFTSAAVNTLDFVLFLLVVRWLVGLGFGRYWHALRWTVVNSAAAAATMLATRLLLEPSLGVGWLLLVISAAVGVLTYLALALACERRYLLQMVALVRPVVVARASS